MDDLAPDMTPGGEPLPERIEVAKSDLLTAWSVLENLAVSLDQIGGYFGEAPGAAPDPERRRSMLEVLDSYLTPSLLDKINQARIQLARYVPDEEAEALSDQIPYWDYAATSS